MAGQNEERGDEGSDIAWNMRNKKTRRGTKGAGGGGFAGYFSKGGE